MRCETQYSTQKLKHLQKKMEWCQVLQRAGRACHALPATPIILQRGIFYKCQYKCVLKKIQKGWTNFNFVNLNISIYRFKISIVFINQKYLSSKK